MKNTRFLAILCLVFVFATISASAQNQEAAVEIAGQINLSGEKTTSDFTKCVSDLKGSGAKIKDAIRSCKEVVKIASETKKKIANESADATKASRPVVLVDDRYGYNNYGSSQRVVVVQQPQNQIQPQPQVERKIKRKFNCSSPEACPGEVL